MKTLEIPNIDPNTGKRKRGRPKKIQISDKEQSRLDQVIEEESIKEKNKELEEDKQIIEDAKKKYRKRGWDYPKDQPIPYFDLDKTYEATGYKPINKTEGLDFDPSWFTEARDTYLKTGHYCQYAFGSRMYIQYWNEQYRRCRHGMTVNGYTITGPNYFFLNFYTLDDNRTSIAGGGRKKIFPRFRVYQYEFFHYYELCRVYRYNCNMLKNRGCGFSHLIASILACTYTCWDNSICIITAFTSQYVSTTMSKVTDALDYLNSHTDGGMFKLRQAKDNAFLRKASHYEKINGQLVEQGDGSMIEGIVADDSRKVRGDRANVVVYEEAGSNPKLEDSFIKGEELVNPGGNKIGISIAGGTGGDVSGAEGLRKLYDNPATYGILPFKHHYTADGETQISGYFIPAYKTLDIAEYVDSRGWCDEEQARKYYEEVRNTKSSVPTALLKYCAEQCFTAEEALSLEGSNKFNKVAIANQIAYIRTHKDVTLIDGDGKERPAVIPIQSGELRFLYKNKSQGINATNIQGVQWIPGNEGKIHIIEKPLWEIDKSVKMKAGLYVAGIDSIDIGSAQTSDYTEDPSKFCIIIYKRAFGMSPPMPVAYYMDRPNQAEEAYQKALKLMIWYNCRCNIEATRLTMWNYSRNRGFADYFMARPRATYMDLNKRHSTTIGTPATPTIIDHQTDLIAHYVDEFCDQIWFPELLDQLNRYSDENKGKFDMIAAYGMALLADEELNGVVAYDVEDTSDQWQDIGWYKDERGISHWGVIPKQTRGMHANFNTNNEYNELGGWHSSDPRKMRTYE